VREFERRSNPPVADAGRSTDFDASAASGCQRHHELAAPRFDTAGDAEVWRQSTKAVDEPIGRFIGVCPAGAPGNDFFATLTPQSFGYSDERGRVGDEESLRPRHYWFDRAFAGVAPSVSQTLRCTALSFPRLGGREPVDARSAVIVHRHPRIYRLVAEPAAPAVALGHVVEATHQLMA
jgi:hypothetical protein